MPKTSINAKGFGLVGALVVIVALAAVSGAGAYVYHRNHKTKSLVSSNTSTNSSTRTNTTSTPNPYAGWKSYTTRYDKLSFKYPSNWNLTDTSASSDTDVTPGQDSVALVSNDGLALTIGTGGTVFDGGSPGVKILSSTPVPMLGGTHYLIFASTSDTVGGALVTTTDALPSISNLPASKNIRLSGSAVSGLPAPFDVIDLQYNGTLGSDVHYPVSKFQQDPNYEMAISILKSMSY